MKHTEILKKFLLRVCLAVVFAGSVGCSFLAGNEEPVSPEAPFWLNYVETLRNEESLTGSSLQDLPGAAPSAPYLQKPTAVFADQYRVYVADSFLQPPTIDSARVFVFDRAARTAGTLNLFSSTTSPDARLLVPAGIAVDGGGVIYVSDKQQGRVYAFDRHGAVVSILGRPQNLLTSRGGLGDLSQPGSLAFDSGRNILFVADTSAHQVKAFNAQGMHLFDIGSSGRPEEDFKFPAGIALDRNGRLYVLDNLRMRVFIYDPKGKFLSSFSLKGVVPGQSVRPSGVAVDSDGHIYVTDEVNNNVLIFNPDGTLAITWGRTGRLSGEFWTPAAIFIDSQNYIYIADQMNNRVQTFRYMPR